MHGSGNSWSAPNITADCTVTATFAIDIYTVTASAGANGTITPPAQTVDHGAAASFTVTPATNHHVVSVSGDTCTPIDQGNALWKASNIQADCAVTATFEAKPPPEATPQDVSVPFNTAQAITLAGNDPNPGGPFTFTYAIGTPPAHGTISGFDTAAGTLTYTPTFGYSGVDSFTFTATTENGTSIPATVSLVIAAGQPVAAVAQDVSVAFNTATAILLNGSDTNPGGPFTFTYAIGTPPSHGTLTGFDAAAGTLTYTPASGYLGADSFTFTASTVNGTSASATVSLLVTKPQLALTIDDQREFARYGQIVDYVVTLTNQGDAANKVPVTFTLSSAFDGDEARLTCFGRDAGAECAQDGNDPLRFTATLPANRSLTWLVSVPVRHDAQEASADLGVAALGAKAVTDSNTLVLYRDGFDSPDGDGTQDAPVIEGTMARAILEGDALYELEVPVDLTAATTALLIVRDGRHEVRIEARSIAATTLVRLLERETDGVERATAWTAAPTGTLLVLGSVAREDAPRAIVLSGAQSPIALQ